MRRVSGRLAALSRRAPRLVRCERRRVGHRKSCFDLGAGVSRIRLPGGLARSGYSMLIGIAHRLRPIARAGLVEDPVDVGLHGRLADDKSLGDFGIR